MALNLGGINNQNGLLIFKTGTDIDHDVQVARGTGLDTTVSPRKRYRLTIHSHSEGLLRLKCGHSTYR